MNDRQRELEAEYTAEQVIAEMGIRDLPVCPRAICQRKEIRVQSRESSDGGVSGFLMRVGNKFAIYHASHIKVEGFIRFTLAHELGHYFLPGHAEYLFPDGAGIHESRGNVMSSDPYERQADQFASALLMPPQRFRIELRKAGCGLPAIQRLADIFVTSLTATAIRFAKFNDDPVAVIVSSKNKVNFCFMSEALRNTHGLERLTKGAPISPDTATHTFNTDANNIRLCLKAEGQSTLDLWFDGAPDVEMNEDVVGLGTYGRTLTVLHTDQVIGDDDEETEPEEDNGFDRTSRSGPWRS